MWKKFNPFTETKQNLIGKLVLFFLGNPINVVNIATEHVVKIETLQVWVDDEREHQMLGSNRGIA